MTRYISYIATSVSLLQENKFNLDYEGKYLEIETLNEPTLKPKYGKIIICVFFEENTEYESAYINSIKLVNKFLTYFSYTTTIGFSKAEFSQSNFWDTPTIPSSMTVTVDIMRPINNNIFNDTLKNLKKNSLNIDFLEMYQAVLNNTDPIAQFMLLYSILEFIIPDKLSGKKEGQKRICDFAEKYSYEKKYYNHVKERDECIFSHLRNKIGHTDSTINLEDTKKDIKDNVFNLAGLLKEAIKDYH